MPGRTIKLVKGETYHICNKSIEGFVIFKNEFDYQRMLETLVYYSYEESKTCFSIFQKSHSFEDFLQCNNKEKYVQIVSYCLMPTHIHLVLKQLRKNGISYYMQRVCNSYSRYFNNLYKRKGPLWMNRFTNVLINSDELLLGETRYIHLNPATSYLVDLPGQWEYSSYNEYIHPKDKRITSTEGFMEISSPMYKEFVESYIETQREIAKSKNRNYTSGVVHPRYKKMALPLV